MIFWFLITAASTALPTRLTPNENTCIRQSVSQCDTLCVCVCVCNGIARDRETSISPHDARNIKKMYDDGYSLYKRPHRVFLTIKSEWVVLSRHHQSQQRHGSRFFPALEGHPEISVANVCRCGGSIGEICFSHHGRKECMRIWSWRCCFTTTHNVPTTWSKPKTWLYMILTCLLSKQ